jgi:hypothetical protein
MRRLTVALLLLALTSPAPADAKEKCTSMCHFFVAWALVRLCPNLYFNQDGVRTSREFGDLHEVKKQALKFDLAAKRKGDDVCHPHCMKDSDHLKEGTACQFLEVKP